MFINSFNTEMAYGGTLEGNPPLESGASQNDMDYIHIINWKKAEEVVKAGKTETIAGMRVIMLDTTIDEGLLHLVGEPKSPHGVDVTPDGKELVVSRQARHARHGLQLREDRRTLIDAKKLRRQGPLRRADPAFEDAIRGQVEIGLGPLHTQFDDNGYAYTSVFIESTVAKWSLKDLKVVEKIQVHYNIGHIVAAEGDTVEPRRQVPDRDEQVGARPLRQVGPLLPQNFQLIDITGEHMQLLYDMPLPLGEPHYAQMIKADKLNPIEVYTAVGIEPAHRRGRSDTRSWPAKSASSARATACTST